MSTVLIQLVVSFAATIAFAILFNVPREEYLYCGITGAAGWVCYMLVMYLQPSPVIASLCAVLILAIMSRIFAIFRRCPITVFLICGIFPLVPGAGIYYTAYYFIMGQNDLFAAKGAETLKIAVAIALGIVLILSLPGGLFKHFAPKKENK